ncbi:MAG: hypothetical protein F6K30_12165 [Cyanothece sp. SIO2G6]|nr:hypothetical protein [Cyanothece sp. SIO2G6]
MSQDYLLSTPLPVASPDDSNSLHTLDGSSPYESSLNPSTTQLTQTDEWSLSHTTFESSSPQDLSYLDDHSLIPPVPDLGSDPEQAGEMPQDGVTGQATDAALVGVPGLRVETLINGQSAAQMQGALALQPGQSLTWTYNVTNTGTTTFDYGEVVVSDSYRGHPQFDASSDLGADQILSPGEVWRYVTVTTAEELTVLMDFEQDGSGTDLQRGTVVDDEFAAYELTVSTPDHAYGAMIFDSSRPTGGDRDLATPSPHRPTPQRQYGLNNTTPLENVLIISENGNSHNPDDNATGGTLRFEWKTPVRVSRVGILDIDAGEEGSTITTYQADGLITEQADILGLGNNSVQTVAINDDSISRLDVNLVGSGAVYEIEFERLFHNTVQVEAGETIATAAGYYQNGEIITPIMPEFDLTISDLVPVVDSFHGQTLEVTGSITATIANQGNTAITQPFDVSFFDDVNGNQLFDPGIDLVVGETTILAPLASGESRLITAALDEVASFAGALLWGFVDSDNHMVESDEINNLAVSQRECVAPPAEFDPVVEWNKRDFSVAPASNQVMMTPAIIDINDDAIPDIIFSTFTGSHPQTNSLLRAISGADGRELWTVTDASYQLTGLGGVAVGDIDNDQRPEIIANHESGSLIAFEHDGTFKWKSGIVWSFNNWGSASLADLNQDGVPEIIIGSTVLNHHGQLLWRGSAVGGLGQASYLSIVADLDLDGSPEVVAGKSAFHADGSLYWNAAIGDGFPAIGNFDADPNPEIVVVSSGKVNLLEHDGTVKWGGVSLPGGGRGGAPTVADMDGDGEPEIGVAGASRYVVFEADGSIKWQQPSQDRSSAVTGSSVFDFEGDGRAEVVYGDELFLRIYDGTTGNVRYALPKGSGTTYELPVIADVDADGHAEIVAVANNFHVGQQRGIFVIGDRNDTWVPTRQIWNQHSYHITNINDDGTIPQYEENSWQLYNSYRLNTLTTGNPGGAPDLVTSYVRLYRTFNGTTITARVGNGGSQFVAAGVNVAFYQGDPLTGGVLLGTTQTTTQLDIGRFEDVSLAVTDSSIALEDIWVVVDDNGLGQGLVRECHEENNAYTPSLPYWSRSAAWSKHRTGPQPEFGGEPLSFAI